MFHPTLFTWILIAFGVITCLPLLAAQMVILVQPHGQKAKDFLIGKDQEWRDKTHFKSAYGAAWADWLIFVPLFTGGITGIILHRSWGFLLFTAAGVIQLYINTLLWFLEKEYVYPHCGPLAYYTYYWLNFMIFGAASLIYGLLRFNGIVF